MATDAYAVLKSSLDKYVHDAARAMEQELGVSIPVAEVEDVTEAESVLKDAKLACIYQLIRFEESPRAPRYHAMFNVGVKTKDDSGNTLMTQLVNEVKSIFMAQRRLELRDFTGVTASERKGALLIASSSAHAQAFDKQQGIRMITCTGHAVITNGD